MENENKSKLNEEILKILNDGLVNGFENNYLDLQFKYVIVIVIILSFFLFLLFVLLLIKNENKNHKK